MQINGSPSVPDYLPKEVAKVWPGAILWWNRRMHRFQVLLRGRLTGRVRELVTVEYPDGRYMPPDNRLLWFMGKRRAGDRLTFPKYLQILEEHEQKMRENYERNLKNEQAYGAKDYGQYLHDKFHSVDI